MDDLYQGIILAILGFLLGLVGDAIKKAEPHKEKRLTYSIRKIPVVAQDSELPNLVRNRIFQNQVFNVVRFHLFVQSVGKAAVSNVNLFAKSNEGAEIIDSIISTDPPELVEYSRINTGELNSIRIDNIDLQTKQSISIDIFIEFREDPTLNVYWSHEDDVEVLEGAVGGIHSIEESLIGITRNFIFAVISPKLIIGIFYFLSSLIILFQQILQRIPLFQYEYEEWMYSFLAQQIQYAVINVGGFLGYLIALYFYLQIIPYSLSLIRKLADNRDYDNGLEKDLIRIIKYLIFASVSLGLVVNAFNFLFALGTVFQLLNSKLPAEEYISSYQFGNSLGALIGNLVVLYFYLRIIPYASNIVRELRKNKMKIV